MSRYRFVSALYITVALTLYGFSPSEVQAAPIKYSFIGRGSGILGATGFNDAAFTVLINADTNEVAFQSSLGAFGILNLGGTINITGIGVAGFTLPLFVFGGSGFDSLGFGNFSEGNLIAIELAPGADYDLVSNFGPVSGANRDLVQFADVATSLGTLTYSTMSDVVFVASVSSVSSVSEPSSFILAGIGVLGLLGYRLRKVSSSA